MTQSLPTVLITGASTGIGATYAERFARRGHDLVLVARDQARMEALAARLRAESGVAIDIIKADLTDNADIARVEARLRDDETIGVLVNNAGAAAHGGFADQDPEAVDWLIRLNVTSLTRLTAAVVPRFLRQGKGAIINLASVLALAPEISFGVYSATKAFVLTLSQSLQTEIGPKGIYVQAVLPAATRTEIWERSGRDINTIQGVMEVGELVDAALVGFDRKEGVTIPPLPDAGQWETFNGARQAMLPNFAQSNAAARYKAA
ncbi:SDR family oxidoreductase [Labrys miyagiensis]|uniref:SDR family oxidoreductase n=1 Tax=Labrys miyagiensis TaxID=346912 RepID=A0ABQ6CU18_9HYPH|nr:SDR family oxidoreductase [Labrys miyagiensis]GLS23265.1 SDR family oxidoreductase [Labrys miyagiensis]